MDKSEELEGRMYWYSLGLDICVPRGRCSENVLR